MRRVLKMEWYVLMDLSVIVPIYNEEENLEPLVKRIENALNATPYSYEVILVDDGSTDKSLEVLKGVAGERSYLRVICLRRNFGQTAALDAGFRHARGDAVVPMDADQQNDPQDIPRLLAELRKGYDVVSGWRRRRRDPFFTRVLPSKVANWLIGAVTGVRIHDYGCTLKAYRRDILQDVRLYGEMHRFLPALVSWQGGRVTEIEVVHHPRQAGRSKYGISRTFKVLCDLITVKFLASFATSPSYLFGRAGLIMFLLAFLCLGESLYEKFWLEGKMHRNPFTLLALGLFIIGVLFIFQGLLAELVVRIYQQSEKRPTYAIREKVNFGSDADREGGAGA
jgi:glycosyltransferase involved in cell wall biosynthesis